MDADRIYELDEFWEEFDEEDYEEPVGSCGRCGCNIYADEDDGTELCDQCQWWKAF